MAAKLLILDGNSVLHRAYYALPDWRNRSGEATAGVYGFLSMMFKAIDELKPTHVTVVFDTPMPTFRHTMYVGYQTNREKDRQISEDIWGQVEKLKTVMEKFGVPVFCVEGFEADDLAGTLAKQAEAEGFEVVLITGDKDYMQLVDDKVKLYMPQKGLSDGVIVDEKGVVEKLGVKPGQVVDYKALVGDSSDNYPGVTGVGPKTAATLLSKYRDFDEIYKNLGKMEEKMRKKLAEGHEGGVLSRQLAVIRRDAPVKWKAKEAQIPGEKKILEVLKELNYRSLIKRMGGDSGLPSSTTGSESGGQGGLFD